MNAAKTSHLSTEAREILIFLAFFAGFVALAIYLHFRVLNVADTDPFYHYTHAHLYAIHGPLYSSFPWPTLSIVSRKPADLWYGFHILLAPMAQTQSSVLSMKLAGAMVTAACVLLFGATLRMRRISFAYFWALFLLMASGDEMARFIMLRPQELSAGLALLILVAVLEGIYPVAIAAAFFIVWVHFTMTTLLAGVLLAAYIASRICGVTIDSKLLAGVALGAVAGWLLRPHPWWALRLLWAQVGDFYGAKFSHIDLDCGTELYPMKPALFWSMYAPFVALWLITLAAAIFGIARKWVRLDARQSAFLLSTLGLSLLFFAIIFLSASRGKDEWMIFSVAFMAASISWIVLPPLEKLYSIRLVMPVYGALLLSSIVVLSAMSLPINKKLLDDNFSPYRFQSACAWLQQNTRPKEIVFSSYWMYFSEMFFWDPNNLYIGAADPVFEYVQDHRKFWEWESLNHPQFSDHMTDRQLTHPGPPIDIHTALVRDFHAGYIVVFRQFQPLLLYHLTHDKRFKLVHFDGGLDIFKVL